MYSIGKQKATLQCDVYVCEYILYTSKIIMGLATTAIINPYYEGPHKQGIVKNNDPCVISFGI